MPAGDLPGHLRPDVASFRGAERDAGGRSGRIGAWRHRLAQLGPGLKVGISWRVGQTPLDALRRWVPLGHWHGLLRDRRAQFVSLQPGDCTHELASCRQARLPGA